jgi:two-component system, cell cycle response regulator DivK
VHVTSPRPKDARPKPGEPKESGSAAVRPAHTLTILVVDDVLDTRDMYARYFRFQGMRVVTAADGVAALQAVQFERPDVIVLDLAMPHLSGLDVIKHLKGSAITRAIPIVVVSGQDMPAAALLEGADSYCEKPCVPEALLREVVRILREPRKRSNH